MLFPFGSFDSAVARELDMLAAKSCLKTKPSLHAARMEEGILIG
jgi:hypothetical protein